MKVITTKCVTSPSPKTISNPSCRSLILESEKMGKHQNVNPLKLHLVGDHHPPWHNQFLLTKKKLNMKHIFSFFSLLVLTSTAFGQLTKGHWLVGGSGRFYSYQNNYQTSTFNSNGKYTQIDLSPTVGYFLANKFSMG